MNPVIGEIIGSNVFSHLGEWITSQTISLILTCIVFLGFLYQLYSRKINFGGIFAFFALLMIFLGFVIQGSLTVVTIMIFIIGVILVIIELFVFGAVLGIIGMILIILSFITLGNDLPMMLFNVVFALILTLIEWVILVKFFKKSISLFDKVVLKDSTSKESGYTSHNDRSHLVDQTAVTYTDLRPSGIIILNNERIDAVSEGSYISKDTEVKIIEVEGTRVVVREN
ncbi:NfeD family protein [Staphylococcus intermedius]|uniref:Membrane-bound serine protease n=1 Tax=Staphylococcus intermedius NCTC 11048 TaxID=1141106 RepID=A0A380G8M5_STAIN|nr:NfeD family protein [Staphylococcus intermedius]PCF64788.1 serine protease [Staphylococcus intermedius]PCF80398.1 serine protease [Staphylococcus intermedius]PCF81748.1 serine protease [Staphylococcus intermedius]PCF88086.1 serine protease [Staphylococcus intermedius]PCF88799.1 serine protease [Staphylococcus intermedius]